jgi:hypothetical protein
MQRREPGRDLRILFTEEDRVLEVTAGGDDDPADIADSLVAAIATDDANAAERLLRSEASADTQIKRIG